MASGVASCQTQGDLFGCRAVKVTEIVVGNLAEHPWEESIYDRVEEVSSLFEEDFHSLMADKLLSTVAETQVSPVWLVEAKVFRDHSWVTRLYHASKVVENVV